MKCIKITFEYYTKIGNFYEKKKKTKISDKTSLPTISYFILRKIKKKSELEL